MYVCRFCMYVCTYICMYGASQALQIRTCLLSCVCVCVRTCVEWNEKSPQVRPGLPGHGRQRLKTQETACSTEPGGSFTAYVRAAEKGNTNADWPSPAGEPAGFLAPLGLVWGTHLCYVQACLRIYV
jgi:hypothetical protein